MRLTSDIELIEGLPIAYIKSIKSIVVSDLHLGYESGMAKNGVLIPKTNLRNILKSIGAALKGRNPESMIIVGDIKNDFSNVEPDELNELAELVKFVSAKGMSIVLVKGNHDNFIERYSRHFKIGVLNSGARIGEYLFAHGDKALLDFGKKEKPKTIVMGHEHPSIGIPMKIGRTERLRCFLYGRYKRIPMLVLPAMGYFETGSDVNTHTRNIMSPILRKADLKNMHAIAFGNGSTIDFGSISDLRKISQN